MHDVISYKQPDLTKKNNSLGLLDSTVHTMGQFMDYLNESEDGDKELYSEFKNRNFSIGYYKLLTNTDFNSNIKPSDYILSDVGKSLIVLCLLNSPVKANVNEMTCFHRTTFDNNMVGIDMTTGLRRYVNFKSNSFENETLLNIPNVIKKIEKSKILNEGINTKNLKELQESFKIKLDKYITNKSLSESDKLITDLKIVFDNASKLIAEVSYKSFSLEISKADILSINLRLNDTYFLMTSLSFDNYSDSKDLIAVYTLFENNERVVSDAKNIKEIVEGAKELLAVH